MTRMLQWGGLGLAFLAGQAAAVDPYDNIAGPDGSYALLYPSFYAAEQYADASGKTVNHHLQLRSYANVFRYSRAATTESGANWLMTALLPVADVRVGRERAQGQGDLTLGSAYWAISNTAQSTSVVLAGFVDVPVGQYDRDDAVTVGAHVWKVRPTIGLAQQWGRIDVELTGRYNCYFKNADSGVRNGAERILESYAGFTVQPGLIVGLHANLIKGQDSERDGQVVPDTAVSRYQAGASVNWMLAPTTGAMLEWVSDRKVRNGAKGDLLMARLFWKL